MQLTDEGVAQLFTQQPGNVKIVGTVGELQFEVIQFRLLQEYGAACSFHSLNYYKACWVTSTNKEALDAFLHTKRQYITFDKDEQPVFMADSDWALRTTQKNFPDVEFHFTSEFKTPVK